MTEHKSDPVSPAQALDPHALTVEDTNEINRLLEKAAPSALTRDSVEWAERMRIAGLMWKMTFLGQKIEAEIERLRSASPEQEKDTMPSNCPFCGGPAYATRTVNGTQMFHVGCPSCGVEMKAAWYRGADKPTKDILALWNRRSPSRAPMCSCGMAPLTVCELCAIAEYQRLEREGDSPSRVTPEPQTWDEDARANQIRFAVEQLAAIARGQKPHDGDIEKAIQSNLRRVERSLTAEISVERRAELYAASRVTPTPEQDFAKILKGLLAIPGVREAASQSAFGSIVYVADEALASST